MGCFRSHQDGIPDHHPITGFQSREVESFHDEIVTNAARIHSQDGQHIQAHGRHFPAGYTLSEVPILVRVVTSESQALLERRDGTLDVDSLRRLTD